MGLCKPDRLDEEMLRYFSQNPGEIELIRQVMATRPNILDKKFLRYFSQDPFKPSIIYIANDLNEPEDSVFYSDRFACNATEDLGKRILEQVGCSVFSLDIWHSREKVSKVVELWCLSEGTMTRGDKIVVTGIIKSVNRSDGYPYFNIFYRVDRVDKKD